MRHIRRIGHIGRIGLSHLRVSVEPGFTLIELLVVIALIAIIGITVYKYINPLDLNARAKDAGRKSSIVQLGKAIYSFYTLRSEYPSIATWDTEISTFSKELKLFPSNPPGTVECGINARPNKEGYCYSTAEVNGLPEALVYVHLESEKETERCDREDETWYVWSSTESRAGLICHPGAPKPGLTGLLY